MLAMCPRPAGLKKGNSNQRVKAFEKIILTVAFLKESMAIVWPRKGSGLASSSGDLCRMSRRKLKGRWGGALHDAVGKSPGFLP
jgi:hypothetical protein